HPVARVRLDAGGDGGAHRRPGPALPRNARAPGAGGGSGMTRAPHPALRGLYRQAALPSQMMVRLRCGDEMLTRLDPELTAGGDERLVQLLRGLELGAL